MSAITMHVALKKKKKVTDSHNIGLGTEGKQGWVLCRKDSRFYPTFCSFLKSLASFPLGYRRTIKSHHYELVLKTYFHA